MAPLRVPAGGGVAPGESDSRSIALHELLDVPPNLVVAVNALSLRLLPDASHATESALGAVATGSRALELHESEVKSASMLVDFARDEHKPTCPGSDTIVVRLVNPATNGGTHAAELSLKAALYEERRARATPPAAAAPVDGGPGYARFAPGPAY